MLEQADFLAANGCDAMQGFLFDRPMPVDEWLARNKRMRAGMFGRANR